jgi:hypothetical protein
MSRRLVALVLGLALLAGSAPARPVAAQVPGAITWTVDHTAKTITVLARLQIYSGCSGNPYGESGEQARACSGVSSQVTQFLALKIKAQIEAIWNKPYMYRCYKLIFIVDITLAPDAAHLDSDRIGVMIDPSFAGIRDFVRPEEHSANWNSNDPADKIVPQHEGTTWGEASQLDAYPTYAHEFGHILGLSDAYHDEVGADGKTISVPNPGAPDDLMSTGKGRISQETIDRLVERNGIHEKDLKCACVNPSPPTTDRSSTGPIAAVARFVTAQRDSGPIAQAEGCGYVGTVTKKYTNNMSSYGFDQKIELNLNGTVTWQINPNGGTHKIPGSIVYWPVDGSITWEEHGSITATGVSCTIKGGGTYAIRDPAHYQFYSSMEVATDPATGVSHYFAIGLEPPGSEIGDVKITCTPSGIDFPPGPEDLAASWLLTGSTEELEAGGKQSDPDGHLRGSYTEDSSNQGTGIRTFTWDLQPY